MKKIMKSAGSALPIVGGAIAGKFVKNLAGKVVQNPMLRSAAVLVAGIVVASSKGETMKKVGYGMIAVGGADLAGTVVPSLAGIEDMDLGGLFDEVSGNVLNDEVSGAVLNDEVYDDVSGDDY